jgi:hypothetical protein
MKGENYSSIMTSEFLVYVLESGDIDLVDLVGVSS